MILPPAIEKSWNLLSAALPVENSMVSISPQAPRSEQLLKTAKEAARGLHPMLQAAIFIYVDDLDAAHNIVQVFDDTKAAYWHGFLHRREGDFSNAKYWFRRAAPLPAQLGQDPFALTDQFAALKRREEAGPLVGLQRAEWMALFEHCAKEPAG
jgi:hypothetical protein